MTQWCKIMLDNLCLEARHLSRSTASEIMMTRCLSSVLKSFNTEILPWIYSPNSIIETFFVICVSLYEYYYAYSMYPIS